MIWFIVGFAAGLEVALILFYVLFWPWCTCDHRIVRPDGQAVRGPLTNGVRVDPDF